jgi:hypothetical protein
MTVKAIERKVQMPEVDLSQKKVTSETVSQLHETVRALVEAHNYHDDTLNLALRGGISVANNSRQKIVSVTVQMPSDAPWKAMTLAGTWAKSGTLQGAQYLMEPGGRVSTRGCVAGGGAGHVGDLPLGYAPPADTYVPAAATVDTTGRMLVTGGAIAPVLTLSGVAGIYSLHASWLASPNAAAPHPFLAPWPIIVQHGFNACLGLVVESCREETQNARTTCGAEVVDWDDRGDGTLRIKGVWGLAWGKKYTMRLRLNAEEA